MSISQRFSHESQLAFIRMLSSGKSRFEAGRALNVSAYSVRQLIKEDQAFREAVLLAEEEASEPVEGVLYACAMEGQPWAVKMWLERRAPSRWGPVANASAGEQVTMNVSLMTLQERLETRKQAIEGTVVPQGELS